MNIKELQPEKGRNESQHLAKSDRGWRGRDSRRVSEKGLGMEVDIV